MKIGFAWATEPHLHPDLALSDRVSLCKSGFPWTQTVVLLLLTARGYRCAVQHTAALPFKPDSPLFWRWQTSLNMIRTSLLQIYPCWSLPKLQLQTPLSTPFCSLHTSYSQTVLSVCNVPFAYIYLSLCMSLIRANFWTWAVLPLLPAVNSFLTSRNPPTPLTDILFGRF